MNDRSLQTQPHERNDPSTPEETMSEQEQMLWQELEAAHSMNRKILRQLKRAQDAVAEASRAHTMMVDTLTETMRENMVLSNERDIWKARAMKRGMLRPDEPEPGDVRILLGIGKITEAEARAIRKTMARLHHPDAGGDPERMKAWNAALDQIEQVG